MPRKVTDNATIVECTNEWIGGSGLLHYASISLHFPYSLAGEMMCIVPESMPKPSRFRRAIIGDWTSKGISQFVWCEGHAFNDLLSVLDVIQSNGR